MEDDSPACFEALPQTLKFRLAHELHKSTLARVPFFSWLPSEAIHDLSSSWTKSVFTPRDVILEAQELADSMYFILRGAVTVKLKVNYTSWPVCDREVGDFFGSESVCSQNFESIHSMHTRLLHTRLCITRSEWAR